jgi:hypothetical protein
MRKWNGLHEWLQMPMPDFYSSGLYTHADKGQVHRGFWGCGEKLMMLQWNK